MKKKCAAALCSLSILVAAVAAFVPRAAAEAEPVTVQPSASSASSTAASPTSPVSPRETAQLSGRFILWTDSTKTYVAIPAVGNGGVLATTAWPTESAAHLRAVSWIFPAPGTTGPIWRADKCLNVGALGSRVTAATCNGSASQKLRLAPVSGGWAIRSVSIPDSYVDFDPAATRLRASRVADADTLRMNLLTPAGYRDIKVTSVTPGVVGEAVISGTATTGASILLGSQIGEATSSGAWTMKATGIPAGGAVLTISQSVGGTSYGSTRATVPAWPTAPGPPTAVAAFEDDVHKNAKISGTGIEGATVLIRLAGAEIARAKVVSRKWSTEIAAPGPGSHDLAVTQTVGALESSPVSLAIDYGEAVSIVTPEDGSTVLPGEPLGLSGRGEPGSLIEVRMDDGDVVGTATVLPDGTWSVPDVPSD